MSINSILDQNLRVFYENNSELNFLIDECEKTRYGQNSPDVNPSFSTFIDSLIQVRITIQDPDSKSFNIFGRTCGKTFHRLLKPLDVHQKSFTLLNEENQVILNVQLIFLQAQKEGFFVILPAHPLENSYPYRFECDGNYYNCRQEALNNASKELEAFNKVSKEITRPQMRSSLTMQAAAISEINYNTLINICKAQFGQNPILYKLFEKITKMLPIDFGPYQIKELLEFSEKHPKFLSDLYDLPTRTLLENSKDLPLDLLGALNLTYPCSIEFDGKTYSSAQELFSTKQENLTEEFIINVFRAKFLQNPILQPILLATGNTFLACENSAYLDENGVFQAEIIGKSLMHVRKELQEDLEIVELPPLKFYSTLPCIHLLPSELLGYTFTILDPLSCLSASLVSKHFNHVIESALNITELKISGAKSFHEIYAKRYEKIIKHTHTRHPNSDISSVQDKIIDKIAELGLKISNIEKKFSENKGEDFTSDLQEINLIINEIKKCDAALPNYSRN